MGEYLLSVPNNATQKTGSKASKVVEFISSTAIKFSLAMIIVTATSISIGHTAGKTVGSIETVRQGKDVADTLRMLYWQAPVSILPYKNRAYKDIEACRFIYEPLATFNIDGRLIPILAAKIPSLENGGLSADRKSVIWKLKQGILWADGTAFTADDVIFTYEYIMNSKHNVDQSFKAIYSIIQNIEKIDTCTVKLNFKMPNSTWALPFTGKYGMIIPRHIFKPVMKTGFSDNAFNRQAVGTGPYRLVEFLTEETLIIGGNVVSMIKAVYESNPFFREPGKPAFSRIELRGGGDAASTGQAVLMDGTADFAFDLQINFETLKRLETGDKGRIMQLFGSDVEFIMLNSTDPKWDVKDGEHSSLKYPHPFFRDKRVRQAIAHSIDRDTIAALYGKTGRPARNVVVSPTGYRSSNPHYEFDLKKAAALLEDAGWKDHDGDGIRDKKGVRLRLRYQTTITPLRQQIQEIVKRGLNSIGIEVDLRAIESSIFFSKDASNEDRVRFFYADLQEYYSGNSSPDPLSYMKRWHSDFIPRKANNFKGHNFERWANFEYDNLYKQSIIEADPEKRRQLIIRLNDMVVDEVVRIPLVNKAVINAASNTLEGIELTPWDAVVWKIKDWKIKD
ncbi:peptide ABC transporter substrate-binding protein [Desulfobacterales bacterium HSG16]|nr:peptide ABC transporter substrate-binding protein [Desulfobacterales bacterium HSG16]